VHCPNYQEGAPKNPRAAGEAIQAALPQSPAVASTSIAGPGFVNFVLSKAWLAARVDAMLRDGIATWAPQLPVRCSARHAQALLPRCSSSAVGMLSARAERSSSVQHHARTSQGKASHL